MFLYNADVSTDWSTRTTFISIMQQLVLPGRPTMYRSILHTRNCTRPQLHVLCASLSIDLFRNNANESKIYYYKTFRTHHSTLFDTCVTSPVRLICWARSVVVNEWTEKDEDGWTITTKNRIGKVLLCSSPPSASRNQPTATHCGLRWKLKPSWWWWHSSP